MRLMPDEPTPDARPDVALVTIIPLMQADAVHHYH